MKTEYSKLQDVCRNFAFENMPIFNSELFEKTKSDSKNKVLTWKKRKVIISDVDHNAIEIAQKNAQEAWVSDFIEISQKDFHYYTGSNLEWVLVSNPPYWVRIQQGSESLEKIYKDLYKLFLNNPKLSWGVFTAYKKFSQIIDSNRKPKKMFNWDLETIFYKLERKT